MTEPELVPLIVLDFISIFPLIYRGVSRKINRGSEVGQLIGEQSFVKNSFVTLLCLHALW